MPALWLEPCLIIAFASLYPFFAVHWIMGEIIRTDLRTLETCMQNAFIACEYLTGLNGVFYQPGEQL